MQVSQAVWHCTSRCLPPAHRGSMPTWLVHRSPLHLPIWRSGHQGHGRLESAEASRLPDPLFQFRAGWAAAGATEAGQWDLAEAQWQVPGRGPAPAPAGLTCAVFGMCSSGLRLCLLPVPCRHLGRPTGSATPRCSQQRPVGISVPPMPPDPLPTPICMFSDSTLCLGQVSPARGGSSVPS